MAADDNEAWGPGEMTRALKRIESKVDEGNRKAVTRDLYDRDRDVDAQTVARIEKRQDDHEVDVDRRFSELAEKSRWTAGNWLAVGLAAFSGAIALYTAFSHGGA